MECRETACLTLASPWAAGESLLHHLAHLLPLLLFQGKGFSHSPPVLRTHPLVTVPLAQVHPGIPTCPVQKQTAAMPWPLASPGTSWLLSKCSQAQQSEIRSTALQQTATNKHWIAISIRQVTPVGKHWSLLINNLTTITAENLIYHIPIESIII